MKRFQMLVAAAVIGLVGMAGSSAKADPVGGRLGRTTTVSARSTDTFVVTFYGGELARVRVSGDGDTDLDLYVYDENGNLIEKDVDPGDDCEVTFRPRWTGKFIIRVVNLGSVSNRYTIVAD